MPSSTWHYGFGCAPARKPEPALFRQFYAEIPGIERAAQSLLMGMLIMMLNLLCRLDRRGSVSLEYLIVVVFAGLVVVLAVVPVLGPAIVDEYTIRRSILYSSFP